MSLTRTLIIIAALIAVAYAAPVASGPSIYASIGVLGVVILLGAVLLKALNRHQDLSEWIALELNKVRRVYHLGKNLGQSDHLRAWFTELHGNVYGYLTAFEGKDFSQYEETNGDFRKLSYHVYQIPELKTDKERALYDELLDATGVVAGARQRIKQLREGEMPAEVWTVFYAMTGLAGIGVLLSVGSADRLVAALLLSVMTLALFLVRDLDRMRHVSGRQLAKKYVENIARLELSRERDEEDREAKA